MSKGQYQLFNTAPMASARAVNAQKRAIAVAALKARAPDFSPQPKSRMGVYLDDGGQEFYLPGESRAFDVRKLPRCPMCKRPAVLRISAIGSLMRYTITCTPHGTFIDQGDCPNRVQQCESHNTSQDAVRVWKLAAKLSEL